MIPKFKVGDKVRYRAEGGEPWSGLTVKEVIAHPINCPCSGCFTHGPAYRILATRDDGGGSIEAAERYFELEES